MRIQLLLNKKNNKEVPIPDFKLLPIIAPFTATPEDLIQRKELIESNLPVLKKGQSHVFASRICNAATE